MRDDPSRRAGRRGITRRRMIGRSSLAMASAWTLPPVLERLFLGLEARAQGGGPAAPGEGPIVVIVEMNGGNDALNTVVPYQGGDSATYYGERPTLAIPPEAVLPLDDRFGLHPALANLKALWDGAGAGASELAVVHGVGYPSPNLSHFTSTDFWHTGRPNALATDGWLGRFFEHRCESGACDPSVGIDLSQAGGLAFQSSEGHSGIAVARPAGFRWTATRDGRADPETERLFRRLVEIEPGVADSPSSVRDGLAFVRDAARRALASSRELAGALETVASAGGLATEFPDSALGRQLASVASLVRGGMPTEIFYAYQGGFDTHAEQFGVVGEASPDPLAGRHADLLAELDAALGAFVREMKAQGNWERVLVFTVSEFGRKVPENGSRGTDHGAGSCLLAMGGGVVGGRFGKAPSLAAPDRVKNHSLQYHVDFRDVYATVLRRWLGVAAADLPALLPSAPSGGWNLLPFVRDFS